MLKTIRSVALALAMMLGVTGGIVAIEAEPAGAASGCNGELCIFTPAGQSPAYSIRLVLSPYLSGRYHVHLWLRDAAGYDHNTPEADLVGGYIYTRSVNLRSTEIYALDVGETICGELWRRGPNGWESWGLPCVTHR